MAPYFKICRRENLGKYQECLSSPESQFNFQITANNEGDTCSAETPFSSDDPKHPVQSQKHFQIQCQYSPSLEVLEQISQLYALIAKFPLLAAVRCDEIKKTSGQENFLHQPAQSEDPCATGVCVSSGQGIQLLKNQSHLQPGLSRTSISNENNIQCVVQTAGPQKFKETKVPVKQEQFYSCNFCQKKFRKKCHATEHLRTHTGEKPFPCPVCGKYFRTKSQVKQHGSVHFSRPNE